MNILVITPIYPEQGIGENFTKVVHYFTKEWLNLGENVMVVSIPSYFPKLFYFAPDCVKRIINQKFGSALPEKQYSLIERYTIEDVPVLKVPLFKLFPGLKISKKVLNKAVLTIKNHLLESNFKPDIIVAHWTEPSLYFVDQIKKFYSVPSVVVAHVNYIKHYKELISSVDVWGYRRFSCINDFKRLYPEIKFSFRCHSGIPDFFLENLKDRSFDTVNSFIYVGMMLPRKHPDAVIKSITDIFQPDDDFQLNLIGNGSMLNELRKYVEHLNYSPKIHLPGRLEREKIRTELDKSQVFIMISEDEVYGLVYIEAMARGCITIASKGEGMDGIIENGKNGFLIEAGNTEQLTSVIRHIQNLTSQQRKQISLNAIETARTLTNRKVALDYLSELKKLVNNVNNPPNSSK